MLSTAVAAQSQQAALLVLSYVYVYVSTVSQVIILTRIKSLHILL